MSEFKVWRIVPLSMVTTCKEERDKWIEAGHDVVEFVSIELVKELESQLEQAKKDSLEAKQDQARYQFVRDMSAEDFGNLSTINELFDCAIDEVMQENQQ